MVFALCIIIFYTWLVVNHTYVDMKYVSKYVIVFFAVPDHKNENDKKDIYHVVNNLVKM